MERLEPVARVDGIDVAVDQPLSILEPGFNSIWWGFRGMHAARTDAVVLIYSPPHLLHVFNGKLRPITVTHSRHPEPILIAPSCNAAITLLPDGSIDVHLEPPLGV